MNTVGNCRHGPHGPILETATLPDPFAHCAGKRERSVPDQASGRLGSVIVTKGHKAKNHRQGREG